ncbi:hypothetical protein FRX31_006226, partial [Thalictrum thalictroides]
MGPPKKSTTEKSKSAATASGKRPLEGKEKLPIAGKNLVSLIPNEPDFSDMFGSGRIEVPETVSRKRKDTGVSNAIVGSMPVADKAIEIADQRQKRRVTSSEVPVEE